VENKHTGILYEVQSYIRSVIEDIEELGDDFERLNPSSDIVNCNEVDLKINDKKFIIEIEIREV
jgi:hypothetical protein